MDSAYLTQERYDELKKELENLKKEGRQEMAKRLKIAKELGDLSENSEYQQAREDQARLEQHISQIENTLRKTVIIKKTDKPQNVRIGSMVKVKRDDKIMTFTIVGSNEAEPAAGKISNESPTGRALLGRKVGEFVKVKTPRGEVEYQILAID